MNKIILFLFCSVLSVVKGSYEISDIQGSAQIRIDNFLNFNRREQDKKLQQYEERIVEFYDNFEGHSDGLNLQLNMVSSSADQNEQIINPYEVLSDVNHQCVQKYRPQLVSKANTYDAINKCISTAKSQVEHILQGAVAIKNELKLYYKNDFQNEIEKCHNECRNDDVKLTQCVITVANAANEFFKKNLKKFNIELDEAECTAKITIKTAYDCVVAHQHKVTSTISLINLLINNCVWGNEGCPKCNDCAEEIFVNSQTLYIKNPLFNHNEPNYCVNLKLQ